MSQGNISPCPTRVTRINEEVKSRIRSRYGKGCPAMVLSGIARAAASETIPRTPVNACMKAHCHGGERSRLGRGADKAIFRRSSEVVAVDHCRQKTQFAKGARFCGARIIDIYDLLYRYYSFYSME